MFSKRCTAGLLCVMVALGASVLQAQEQTPSEQQAQEAYRQGSFSRAVQLYTQALAETSDAAHRARLHVRIAWTLFALGREAEVDTHLQAALLEAPDLTLVPDYYTQEFLDLFEEARRKAFATSQGGGDEPLPDLEATLAMVEQRVSTETDVEGALADVDRLIDAFPTDGRLLPLRLEILEKLGRQEEADELRRRLAVPGSESLLDRLSIPDLILRANQHLDQGDIDTSRELLREAVARQPSNVAALELMAEAARRAARWQEAEYALKSALALQPDNIGLRLRLGEVYLATGDASAARDVFRLLTEQFPHSDRAWAALGLIDARLGNLERAKEELAKALHENPLLPEVQLAYGELLLLEGDVDQALEALRSASNLLQDDPQVEARLGQALLARQRTDEALVHLRNAVEGGFQPDDVKRSLVLAMMADQRYSEAQRVLDELSTDPRGDTGLLRGLLLLARAELAEAEAVLTEVARARSNDPEVLNMLAAALYRQARYQEAVVYLRQANQLQPDSSTVRQNLVHAEAAVAAEVLGAAAQPVRPAGP